MPRITVNDTELYYERHGTGVPIVFCHGDGRDHRTWSPQIEELSNEFQVIVYDLNGYGRSGGSEREELSYETHVADLHGLITGLELERPVVVGWSMGGRVAYTLAARYPQSLVGLVVLEPAAPRLEELSLPLITLSYIFPPIASVIGWPRLFAVRRWIASRVSDEVDQDVVAGLGTTKSEYEADAERRVDTSAYNKMWQSMRSERMGERTSLVSFSSIHVPTLALTGEDPRDTYAETVSRLVKAVPDGRGGTIPDTGHAAHLDSPSEFNRRLQHFVMELTNDGPRTL